MCLWSVCFFSETVANRSDGMYGNLVVFLAFARLCLHFKIKAGLAKKGVDSWPCVTRIRAHTGDLLLRWRQPVSQLFNNQSDKRVGPVLGWVEIPGLEQVELILSVICD